METNSPLDLASGSGPAVWKMKNGQVWLLIGPWGLIQET